FVKLGIRTEGGVDWPWARVRRVLDARIWVTVGTTHPELAEEHAVDAGDEMEVLPEEIHIAVTEEGQQRVSQRQEHARERTRLEITTDKTDALAEILYDNETPHVVIEADHPGVEVPRAYVKNGKIVLTMSNSAIKMNRSAEGWIEFDTQFSG